MLAMPTPDARLAGYFARFARRAGFLRVCALCLIAPALIGCADSYLGARAVVVQGKYDPNTCEQLAAFHKALSTKIEHFERLQKKADSDPAGFLVGGMAYGPTVAQARGDRRLVEETQAEKNCQEKPNP
jgi:hypothetical protein